MKKIIIAFAAVLLAALTLPFAGCSDKRIAYIEIDSKSEYKSVLEMGDALDVTGLKIKLYSKDDLVIKTVAVTEDMVSGYVNYILGRQTLTVIYGNFKATYDVNVVLTPAKISLVGKTGAWYKNKYKVGEELDTSEMLLQILNKNDRIVESITPSASMIEGFDTASAGEFTATVSYGGFTTEFSYIVEN